MKQAIPRHVLGKTLEESGKKQDLRLLNWQTMVRSTAGDEKCSQKESTKKRKC